MRGLVRRSLWRGRLFLETNNSPVPVGLNYAKLPRGLRRRHLDRGDGNFRAGIDVLLQHLGVIHFVNVVAGQDEGVLGTLAAKRIDVLVHGVGGALVPLLRDAHLRRQNFDEFAEAHERRPPCSDVASEAERFVLREHKNAMQAGIYAIGKCDVDDAVESAERNGGLGAVARQGPQALALTSGEKYSNGVAHIGHGGRLPKQKFEALQCTSRGKQVASCSLVI